jgi:3-oxoacyl-[acyl-carrier protein] reductase
MGRSTAEVLLAEGAAGLALLDYNSQQLAEVKADLTAEYPKANILTAHVDVQDPQQVEEAVKSAYDAFGQLDGAVNAAGVRFEGFV